MSNNEEKTTQTTTEISNKSNKKQKSKKKILLSCLGKILLIYVAFSLIIVVLCYDAMFSRTTPTKYSMRIQYEDIKNEYERDLISFESGDNTLQGYHYGKNNEKGLIVISHGLGASAENYLAETLYFVDNGYQVFSYDNTGCHNSEGDNSRGLSQSVIDLDSALSYIESDSRFTSLPILLFGHSWGGYAVTAIFNFDHNITASVSLAGFNEPISMIFDKGKQIMGPLAYIEYPILNLYHRFLFMKNANLTAVDGINNTSTPILLIHGNADEVINHTTVGTIAFKNEITNPNVQYKLRTNERQNNHTQLCMSLTALEYIDELNIIYNELSQKYDNKIPEEELKAFYDSVDKKKASLLNEEIMQDILKFYEDSLK